jgi:hypothetical protein
MNCKELQDEKKCADNGALQHNTVRGQSKHPIHLLFRLGAAAPVEQSGLAVAFHYTTSQLP